MGETDIEGAYDTVIRKVEMPSKHMVKGMILKKGQEGLVGKCLWLNAES